MKSPLLTLAFALSVLLVPASAASKPAALAAKDVLFDSTALKRALGARIIVSPLADAQALPAGATAAIQSAGLRETTELLSLPAHASAPKRAQAVPPQYPKELRRAGVSGQAAFLILVGEDGQVRSLYCYQSSHEAFAVAGAQALAQWKFEPARVDGAAVPVLTTQLLQFSTQEQRTTPSRWDGGG